MADKMKKFLTDQYFIPNYQREYSWTQNELEDFWYDLNETKNDESGLNHFFGQIVIHNDVTHNKKFIIDGQQRTVTSTIFLRVLQNIYDEIYKESGLQDADDEKADLRSLLGRKKEQLNLYLGELDEEYFTNNIQLGKPSDKKEKKKSHELLRNAYNFFYDQVHKEIDSISDYKEKIKYLNDINYTFQERFSVLSFETERLEEAFILFETLNARGKELETSDLLKNYIFSKAKDINKAQKKWNSMINKLDKLDATKYIRYYWNSCHKSVRDKGLYREINREIDTPRKSEDLLENLDKYALFLHDMAVPAEGTAFTDVKIKTYLQNLKILKATSFYPIILAILQCDSQFKESDIRKVLETIETYVFRNFTICGKTANKAEVFFSRIAKEIYDRKLDTVELIRKEISEGIVDDEVFISSFENWKGTKSNKETIRYILRKIHSFKDKNNELNINNTEVHIEHIMPEDIKNWPEIDAEVHDSYLWRLGNLALLSGSLNIKASNKSFDEKKPEYMKSKIEPNADIAKYSHWDENSIISRQKEMATYAVKIWKK